MEFGELEGEECRAHLGYPYRPLGKPGIFFPSLPSAMPWKSDPTRAYQTAITSCCVVSFKVTLVYRLILTLHSFGVTCVSIFQGSFSPAHASYKTSRAPENVSNEAVPSTGLCLVLPGQAGAGMHLDSTRPWRWSLLSLETCAKWTKHSSNLTSA